MNSKLVLGFGGISLIVIFVIFFNYFPNESAMLDEQNSSKDAQLIAKNSSFSSEVGFYIDENGTKHYVINVEDNPNLSDWQQTPYFLNNFLYLVFVKDTCTNLSVLVF